MYSNPTSSKKCPPVTNDSAKQSRSPSPPPTAYFRSNKTALENSKLSRLPRVPNVSKTSPGGNKALTVSKVSPSPSPKMIVPAVSLSDKKTLNKLYSHSKISNKPKESLVAASDLRNFSQLFSDRSSSNNQTVLVVTTPDKINILQSSSSDSRTSQTSKDVHIAPPSSTVSSSVSSSSFSPTAVKATSCTSQLTSYDHSNTNYDDDTDMTIKALTLNLEKETNTSGNDYNHTKYKLNKRRKLFAEKDLTENNTHLDAVLSTDQYRERLHLNHELQEVVGDTRRVTRINGAASAIMQFNEFLGTEIAIQTVSNDRPLMSEISTCTTIFPEQGPGEVPEDWARFLNDVAKYYCKRFQKNVYNDHYRWSIIKSVCLFMIGLKLYSDIRLHL